MNDQSPEAILERVREIIAETTANNVTDVLAETQLEAELGVTPIDFKRIIANINHDFSINLDAQGLLDDEITTVTELAVIVREEAVLG